MIKNGKGIINYAFIDGQNLYRGTKKNPNDPWAIDFYKLRIYLRDKYKVLYAYYHMGFKRDDDNSKKLYEELQKAGYIVDWKEHNEKMYSEKKGNIDTDLVFKIMEKIYYKEIKGKVILISGDGDYKKLVDFLIREDKFEKILLPPQYSSLYKSLGNKYYDYINNIKSYIK